VSARKAQRRDTKESQSEKYVMLYLHMKLLDSEKVNVKLLIAIGISALIGSLTHYYYLFYLAMLYITFAVKYIKEKKYKDLIYYTIAMCIAGVSSLIIFPYSIQHMFFGYRGQGVISKLTNIPQFAQSISDYLKKVNRFAFNNLMNVIILAILAFTIYKLIKKQKIMKEKNKYISHILLSMLFYFGLVAVASPWIELRYIMPVCGLIFVVIMYYFEQIVCKFSEKTNNIIMIVTLLAILIAPVVFKLEPEVAYSDKKEIVSQLNNELNVPTIYLFNSGHNRFLDDILLFSIVDESYVAKDLDCTEENIDKILEGKDLSKGMVVFINPGQENDEKLQTIVNATTLEKWTYLKRLNACDVYFLN